MKLFKAFFVVVFALVVLSGCASGPKFNEIESKIPPIKSSEGRIYFYRDASLFGAGIQPSIRLNNGIIGVSKPGGFFYVDTKPGKHEVSCATEVERKAVFTLDAGQTRYIKTTIGLGIVAGRVYPELVDNKLGDKEVREISYIGDKMAEYIKQAKAEEKEAEKDDY